jgi:hypothetical protein
MKSKHILLVLLFLVVAFSSYLISKNQEEGEQKLPESYHPIQAELQITPVQVDRETVVSIPDVIPIEDEIVWWENEDLIKSMTNTFAERFAEYQIGSLLDCNRGNYGDQNIKVTKPSWGRFHRDLSPSPEMFVGSTQYEKWVLAGMIQTVSHTTENDGGLFSRDLGPQAELAFQAKLRNEALYFSPELILQETFGAGWADHEDLMNEVRKAWIELVSLASPVQAELDLRQRCAMHLFGDIDKSQVHLIVPDILELEVVMESFHHEFFNRIVELGRNAEH